VSGTPEARKLRLCYSAQMGLAIGVNLPPVFLTTFSETFGGPQGLSEEELGRIPAVLFTALGVGILAGGAWADRWGGKPFAALGLLFTCLGLLVLGGSQSYGMLLGAISLMGLGAGVLDTVLSPMVAALRPLRKVHALNWLHSFYCTGAVLTVLIGALALRFHVSWRLVAVLIALYPILVMAGFLRAERFPLVHGEADPEPFRFLVAHPAFLAALLGICLGGATEVTMAQWLPAYAELGLGFAKSTGGFALAAFSVAMVVGRLLVARFGDRVGPIPLMILCCAASAVLYLLGCFASDPALALLACTAVGFTSSCLWPTMLSVAANRFPFGGASMFALLAASGNMGCILAPWAVGLVAERSRLDYGLATAALCPIMMAGVLFAIPGGKQEEPALSE